jgi:predicted RNA methylase
MSILKHAESQRLKVQNLLDAAKTPRERNRLGQFATPSSLAQAMLEYAQTVLPPSMPVRFFDPAFGTGAFYSALLQTFSPHQIEKAYGYEVDEQYGQHASRLWRETPLQLTVGDFTRASPPETEDAKATLLVCNPPYIRHHHITREEKARLQALVQQRIGFTLSELAGLYGYFLCLAHSWMAENGLACWLIPNEFMDVNYGQQLKAYLLSSVTLLRIHRFDPQEVQFDDALVSSVIVWFRNELPPPEYTVELTCGESLTTPTASQYISARMLQAKAKWSQFFPSSHYVSPAMKQITLSDLFTIRRGLATGANHFFMLTREQVQRYQLPDTFLTPILPSARYLLTDEIRADTRGMPLLEPALFLLNCDLPEEEVQRTYPSLWRYLQLGRARGVHTGYLCRHRSPWYAQEQRPPAPFLCTYMGRQGARSASPFRFIVNYSQATAANTYLLLYPKSTLANALQRQPATIAEVWKALRSLAPEILIGEGRVYGGGLHKLEPGELANVPAEGILNALPVDQ